MQSQPDLFQVVPALCPTCCFSRLLHRWQQQGDQNGNDGNHDQQFNERESAMSSSVSSHDCAFDDFDGVSIGVKPRDRVPRQKKQAFDAIECMLRFDASLERWLTDGDPCDSPRRSRAAHGLVGPVKRAAQAADEMITGNSNGDPGRRRAALGQFDGLHFVVNMERSTKI
jgi:hypothetical protein